MLVARHWAEHRIQHRVGRGPQVTIRRWGWSNESPDAAAAHARQRAEAALAEALAGHRIGRSERKPGYNGAEGLPIREEILAEHPDHGAVITRNSYGARCLNVGDVLFADVDDVEPEAILSIPLLLLAIPAAVIGAIVAELPGAALGIMAVALLVGVVAVRRLRRPQRSLDQAALHELLAGWIALHPDWRLRLYRSPAGWRVLGTHGPEQPGSAIVTAFFAHLGVDPVYAAMCRKQHCFRARLTGKPWRMGVTLRPPKGSWPHRTPEAQARRERFAAACDAAAPAFAACRFLAEVGSAPEHPHCAAVRDLHDRESRALTDLPLA